MKITDFHDIPAIVKQRREALQWSPGKLADLLGVAVEQVMELELGGPLIRLEFALKALLTLSMKVEISAPPEPLPASPRPGPVSLAAFKRRHIGSLISHGN